MGKAVGRWVRRWVGKAVDGSGSGWARQWVGKAVGQGGGWKGSAAISQSNQPMKIA